MEKLLLTLLGLETVVGMRWVQLTVILTSINIQKVESREKAEYFFCVLQMKHYTLVRDSNIFC